MVQIFRADGFIDEAAQEVAYGFFGRQGGHSKGIYASLNCGVGSNDDAAAVAANRADICAVLGGALGEIYTPYQVHGSVCSRVGQDGFEVALGAGVRPEADAVVTDRVGVVIGVVTADCAPVLFYAPREGGLGGVIGAAHAGWRGAVGGVLEATIDALCQYEGVERAQIRACVGPCIGRASYEVDLGFYKEFVQLDERYESFFSSARTDNKFLFDLGGFCGWRLREAGVSRVSIMDCDTYAREADFFSYRRTTHRGEVDYGRQISAISLRDGG